jgi:hypothetical protein
MGRAVAGGVWSREAWTHKAAGQQRKRGSKSVKP